MSNTISNQAPVLRPRQAAAYLSIGISTFWRWVAEGRLPQGTRLSARCTVWRREALDAFLAKAEAGNA